MKKPLNIKKFLLPNIPYVFIALFATKLGQAWRLAPARNSRERRCTSWRDSPLLFPH